jgi:hypothetical protein
MNASEVACCGSAAAMHRKKGEREDRHHDQVGRAGQQGAEVSHMPLVTKKDRSSRPTTAGEEGTEDVAITVVGRR